MRHLCLYLYRVEDEHDLVIFEVKYATEDLLTI
jgi:hypothetical protein